HPFIVDVSFEDIIALYQFDSKLRNAIFYMLGIVEVAFRTQIVYQFSQVYGSHWQISPKLYRCKKTLERSFDTLQKEIDRSKEDFITHYKQTYNKPIQPPSWMSMEACSFGTLSKIFYNIRRCNEKANLVKSFGLNDVSILENWLRCFTNLRNICAHHSRLWNRRLGQIKLPKNPDLLFIKNTNIHTNKLYSTLVCLQYMVKIICPNTNYTLKIKELISHCPTIQDLDLSKMGFPQDWQEEDFWR
ncbi:MAG: Abi family protein, partial [Bacteroidales bacterium]